MYNETRLPLTFGNIQSKSQNDTIEMVISVDLFKTRIWSGSVWSNGSIQHWHQASPMADLEGVKVCVCGGGGGGLKWFPLTPFETKLFHFHGEFSENQGKLLNNQVKSSPLPPYKLNPGIF